MNDDRRVEIKTENKLLTEYSVECVKDIKGNKEDLRKINKVRNNAT